MKLPNAQNWISFVEVKAAEVEVNEPIETLLSCETISVCLIDRDENLRALPLLALLAELSHRL